MLQIILAFSIRHKYPYLLYLSAFFIVSCTSHSPMGLNIATSLDGLLTEFLSITPEECAIISARL